MYIPKRVKSTTLSCGCYYNKQSVSCIWYFKYPIKYYVFQMAHINRLVNQDSLFKTASINFTLKPNKIGWFNSSENLTNINLIENNFRFCRIRIS